MKIFRRITGLLLLADGIGGLVAPREYLRKLQSGTPLIDDVLEYFSERPELTRKYAVVEIVAGIWLTFR